MEGSMLTRKHSLGLLLILVATGCITGRAQVTAPTPPAPVPNYIIVEKSRAEVWRKAIPRLGQQFFVINTIDPTSGLINVSYSGDPEQYVDGGVITSFVENAAGPRTYTFPATKAQQQYEVYTGSNLLFLNRKMELEGRVNIIVEEIEPSKTKVTANVRYILTKKINGSTAVGHVIPPKSDTASFNSGEPGRFSERPDDLYWPTGALEASILSAFKM